MFHTFKNQNNKDERKLQNRIQAEIKELYLYPTNNIISVFNSRAFTEYLGCLHSLELFFFNI